MKNILALISSSRETFEAARAKLAELDGQILAARVRRSCIEESPLTQADYVEALSKRVRSLGAGFADDMVRFHGSRRMGRIDAARAGARDFPYDVFSPSFGTLAALPTPAACFYFEDAVIAGVKRVAALMTWPDDAIGSEERAELLKAADTEIAEMEALRRALAEAMGERAPVPEAADDATILAGRIAAFRRDDPALSDAEALTLAQSSRPVP